MREPVHRPEKPDLEVVHGSRPGRCGWAARITGRGLAEIPDKPFLQRLLDDGGFAEIAPDRAESESRILYAYEVDGACACDDDICRLPVQ